MVSISQIENKPRDWNITLSSNGTPTSNKIDTGAHCNVIPVESLEHISQTRSQNSKSSIGRVQWLKNSGSWQVLIDSSLAKQFS